MFIDNDLERIYIMTKATQANKKAAATKTEATIDAKDVTAQMKALKTKSNVIRHYASKGFSRSAIASALKIRYQHVRNVLVADAIKADAK